MRDFIDYLQEAFITSSGADKETQYSNLDLTARSLLGFQTPTGSRITLSSFVRPKFGTSYSIGIKDGWISYLYSTHPLSPDIVSSSDKIPLPNLLRCYRSLSTQAIRHAVGHKLVYGRLYLPQSRLEALLSTRISPQVNLALRAVSQENLRHGGTLLGLASWDDTAGRFGVETLASSDGGVLGLRGLWNVTNTASSETSDILESHQPPLASTSSPGAATDASSGDKERINGRFSAGGEIYYGTLNKSGGLSLGGRFQTLPTHHGTPLTATLTFNLVGHMSATYAVMAGDWTLASQFGFNLYSYESNWAVGMELWNKRKPRAQVDGGATAAVTDTEILKNDSFASVTRVTPTKRLRERSFQAKMEWRLDDDEVDVHTGGPAGVATADIHSNPREQLEDDFPAGVFRCRCDQNMRVGLMYEGRYKSLLFSLGTDVDLKKLDAPFRGLGLAVQYSS
ncbi:hypothetical protein M406DRAFT_258902 [Cryphonectria parasitica EP155]|uniref:Mitochondrial distribution and morphology protein 10 n=1 Tax=Cryphonectria parasitica (strain ATCC 38755 / EP155) TaxID=660469 RepID=A0A9P4Y250_CRYP1|nr:uncharacterized protein M406DRAFT_258902 [Cryphonectria parasitica EP155]KAF3765226.1 hypothetical protein M406DRAFT_258902 [Cryphonectria parasitica EP155]